VHIGELGPVDPDTGRTPVEGGETLYPLTYSPEYGVNVEVGEPIEVLFKGEWVRTVCRGWTYNDRHGARVKTELWAGLGDYRPPLDHVRRVPSHYLREIERLAQREVTLLEIGSQKITEAVIKALDQCRLTRGRL
jgi:hypothetical protein